MKKTRFTEEQMVTILREADQRPVPEIAKKHGVSAQTIYGWRKHFGTLDPADIKRLRQLEGENGRLKKMVADRELEIDVLDVFSRSQDDALAEAGRGAKRAKRRKRKRLCRRKGRRQGRRPGRRSRHGTPRWWTCKVRGRSSLC